MLINKSNKILLIVVGIFAVFVFFGAGFLLYREVNQNSDADSDADNSEIVLNSEGPCSTRVQGSILSESVSLFLRSSFSDNENGNVERSKKLFDLEQRIINKENFEKDANCLHILTMLYIERSDVWQSEKYLDLLVSGLEKNNPESYILDENANFLTQEEMRLSIETIKYNIELAKENDPFKNQNRLDEKIE